MVSEIKRKYILLNKMCMPPFYANMPLCFLFYMYIKILPCICVFHISFKTQCEKLRPCQKLWGRELTRKSLLWARVVWLTFDSTGKSAPCSKLLGPDSPGQMVRVVLPSQPVRTGRQTSAGEGREGIAAGRSLKVNAQKACFPSSRNYLVRPQQVTQAVGQGQ